MTRHSFQKNFYYETLQYAYLPHDSWQILLDTRATNTELLDLMESLGPENYVEKLDRLLSHIYNFLKNELQSDQEVEQQCLQEYLIPPGKPYIKERCLATLITQTLLAKTDSVNDSKYLSLVNKAETWNIVQPLDTLDKIIFRYHTIYKPLVKPICKKIEYEQLYCLILLYLEKSINQAVEALAKAAEKENVAAAWALEAIAEANKELGLDL